MVKSRKLLLVYWTKDAWTTMIFFSQNAVADSCRFRLFFGSSISLRKQYLIHRRQLNNAIEIKLNLNIYGWRHMTYGNIMVHYMANVRRDVYVTIGSKRNIQCKAWWTAWKRIAHDNCASVGLRKEGNAVFKKKALRANLETKIVWKFSGIRIGVDCAQPCSRLLMNEKIITVLSSVL